MAITVTQKALDIAADLVSALSVRLPALAIVQTVDTDGCPLVRIGAATAGADGALLKVLPVTTFLSDALGNPQPVYSPHIIDIASEAGGAPVLTAATQMAIFGECLRKGTRVQWYQSTNGTSPSVATLVAGNLVASFDSLYQSGTSTI